MSAPVLQTILTSAAAQCEADEWFNGVSLITDDKGDIEKAVTVAVSRLGVSVLFMLGRARCRHPNLRGPYLEDIAIIAEVAENVTINRGAGGTGKTALAVAERVIATLHQFKPDGVSECIVADDDAIKLAINPPGATVCYHVTLTTNGGLALS